MTERYAAVKRQTLTPEGQIGEGALPVRHSFSDENSIVFEDPGTELRRKVSKTTGRGCQSCFVFRRPFLDLTQLAKGRLGLRRNLS